MRPLVSVITGTRNRQEIYECVEQVRMQTYPSLEHVIVHDGPNQYLREALSLGTRGKYYTHGPVPIVYAETGRVWSDEFVYSDGAAAFQVAQLLAHGGWQMWLSDDETMDPDHITKLMDLADRGNHDFVYSMARWYTDPNNPKLPSIDRVIGVYPPTAAQLTNCLYRTALLDYAKFETHGGRGTDWNQVSQWIAAGASYGFLPEVTFTHRADQVGGVNSNTTRQKLRGHE
jgi:hypothetical protein